jgi:hypothetical protein
MMLGLTFDIGLPLSDLSLRAGVFGGYGMAKLATETKSGSSTVSSGSSGGGFVAEGDLQLRYEMIPLLSLGLDLGYRLANIGAMKSDSSGASIKNSSGGDLAWDYSGVNGGLSLSFNF